MEFDFRRLKAERIAKGLTVQDVADTLGITKGYYSKKENAKAPLDVEEFATILKILGIKDEDVCIFFTRNVSDTETFKIS